MPTRHRLTSNPEEAVLPPLQPCGLPLTRVRRGDTRWTRLLTSRTGLVHIRIYCSHVACDPRQTRLGHPRRCTTHTCWTVFRLIVTLFTDPQSAHTTGADTKLLHAPTTRRPRCSTLRHAEIYDQYPEQTLTPQPSTANQQTASSPWSLETNTAHNTE
jgi:hypothetical protein